MQLNSDSTNNQNSFKNIPSVKRFSNRKSFRSFLGYSIKPTKNVSKFFSTSLSKSKDINKNPRINIIINNNNPINYTGSLSSMYINSFSAEKNLKKIKNQEENSTFIFTGDNQSYVDNGQIIENYLKTPLDNPIFECKSLSSISNKDQNELIPSQEKSFILSSSLSSNTPNTSCSVPKKKNNNNLIKMLKMLNSDSGDKNYEGNNKYKTNTRKNSKFKITIIDNERKINKNSNKLKKKIWLCILLIINMVFYFHIMIVMFQPSVHKLFYDNDHADYKYTISSLSKEKSIIINEGKYMK